MAIPPSTKLLGILAIYVMKKLYEREAPLLQRKRIAFDIPHEKQATPKRDDIKKQIASQLKIDESLISIRHIFTNYGKTKSKAIIHIYNSKDILKKLENRKRKHGKDKEDTQERKEKEKEQKAQSKI